MKTIVLTASLLLLYSCNTARVHMQADQAQAPLIIYRTVADYDHLVPVTLNDAGDRIVAFPAPSDLYYEGELALPVKLDQGYLLDRRGIGMNSAFTSFTYEAYSRLDAPPSPEELYNSIIDKDPFESIYDCGTRDQYEHPVKDLKRAIRSGMKGFKSLIDYVVVRFDSNMEVSGQKFSLEDISPGLPEDWDGYEFVILEFMITTPQRFHVGFTTEEGYNELRVMSYTPKGWNRLAIPLKLYREPPAARSDLAATFNQPRYTGWINLTGHRTPMRGVDSIGIRMQVPIGNPVLKLRAVSLAREDPGDEYLGGIPVVDEFGQYNLGAWEAKITSLEQLRRDWSGEDAMPVNREQFRYSRYGGYLDARIDQGTGFFRTEKVDGRWWFVDPEGYLFLSHGVNCVGPGGGGGVYRLEYRRNLYKELPPVDPETENSRYRAPSYGTWNLARRYGEDYRDRSVDNVITRMDRWGLNTIANWSTPQVYNRNQKAFTLQLRGLGIEGELMGLADVYAPGFREQIDRSVRSTVEPYRDNPWLLGYFTFNEPSFLGREERLCDLILAGPDRPVKSALREYLSASDTPELRTEFIHHTFRIFLETVDQALERHDPNHLTLGIRFGQEAGNEILELCKDVFDVFSFNCYDLYPDRAMMDRFVEVTGKPIFIGEYHFGTVDRGMAQSLWQVDSQEERGVAYRYYTEKAYAHPGLIGTSWFQWCDQDLTGRGNDGENYNCGLVDVTDRPYPLLVEAVSETARRLYRIHSGTLDPVDQAPARARGHHAIPDLWNK